MACLAGALGVGAGPIAHDDLDRRMVLEPRGLGRAVGQQVDAAPALEITEDRAVALAFAPGPVIDAEDTRRERRIEIGLADAAQQGRRAMPIRVAMCAPGLPPSARAMA
jgi:hypothetical protein